MSAVLTEILAGNFHTKKKKGQKTLPTTLDNPFKYLHYREPGIGIGIGIGNGNTESRNAIETWHQNALQSISVFYFIVLSTLKRNVFHLVEHL